MKPDWENVKFGELKIKPNRKLKPCLVCGKIHNYEKYCSKKCYFSQMDKHIVHRMAGTTFYRKWMNIKARCNDPRAVGYKNYGGRGIKLIWKDFRQFYTDMHPSYLEHVKKFGATNTSIDRINNKPPKMITKYIYIYDKKGNWVSRFTAVKLSTANNFELIGAIEREISYFE